MTDADKRKLFRIVIQSLNAQRSRYGRQIVESMIRHAHNGRIEGFMVTTDTLPLFRQYRNAVSPSPAHLIDAAEAYMAERVEDERYVDACEAMEDERVNGRAH
jgi:hypothetical protein